MPSNVSLVGDTVNPPRGLSGHSTSEKWQHGGSVDRTRPSGVCFMYSRILARFWYVIIFLVFLTVGAYSALSLTLYNLPDFADPSQGFETRGTVITSRFRSLSNLESDLRDYSVLLTATPIPLAAEDDQSRVKRQTDTDSSQGVQFCYSIDQWNDFVATMVFEAEDGGNILTAEAVKSVCSAGERLVTSHPLYSENCLCLGDYADRDCPNVWSIGDHIALVSNKTSCAAITDKDISNTMDLLALCAPFVYNRTRPDLQSAVPGSIPHECSQHEIALHTMLYYLLPTEFSRGILDKVTPLESPITAVFFPIHANKTTELQTIYNDNIMSKSNTDGITTLKAVNFFIKFRLFTTFLFADSLYLGIGVGIVFFLIWIYTGSFSVTLTALFNMVFSLVLGYFFVTVVFSKPFFPFGNFMAVILIIGVGADDTFVYTDLWKQSKLKIGSEDLPLLVYETLRHATVTMFVTSVTTAAALFATVISDITAVKCFTVFAGTAIMMNLALTLTLLPAVIVMQHKLTECCCSSNRRSPDSKSKCASCLNVLLKPIKSIYEDVIPFLVTKLRYLWIILLALLMVGGAVIVFYCPSFQLPSQSQFQFFASSHHFEQYDFVYKEQFSFATQESAQSIGWIVWGVRAVDNGNHWDPDDEGTLVLDDSFQFSEPEEQTWFLNFCAEIRNQTFVKPDVPLRCFIEEFIDIMKQDCSYPITEEDESPCCNQTEFPYNSSVFVTCLQSFANKGYFPELLFRKNDSKLAVIKVTFSTIYPVSYLYQSNNEMWTAVNPWVEMKIASAPESLQSGWFISQYFGLLFYDLQESLAAGTRISIVITLAIASGILLVTIQNVLITILAMLTITSAVFVTVASLVLLGWELNIVEATIITLAVGLSVDFTIHYGVAYKLSPDVGRKKRTQYSLSTMTAAITIAALSTFIAGALVLPATVLTYYQFGVFLMLVVSISWSHGTFIFQSLCMTFGPQGSCGDIPCLPCCECCRLGTKPTKSTMSVPRRRLTVVKPNNNNLATSDGRVNTISNGLVDASPVEGSLYLVQRRSSEPHGQQERSTVTSRGETADTFPAAR